MSLNQKVSADPTRLVSSLSDIPKSVSSTVENKGIIMTGFIILSVTLIISGVSIWGNLVHTIEEFATNPLTQDHHDSTVNETIYYLYSTIILGLLISLIWFLHRNSFLKRIKLIQALIVVALISQSWILVVNDSLGLEQHLYLVIGCISCPDWLGSETHLGQSLFYSELIVFLSLVVGYINYFCQSNAYTKYRRTLK